MSDKQSMRFIGTCLLLILMMAVPLRGEPQGVAPPLPGSRVIKAFDFEETHLGNFESIPMFWARVEGRGYPAYSKAGFDRMVWRSRETSFKLETQGGSVAYRYAPLPQAADRRIPVVADSDYYILAFVRSEGLTHARADLVAWFADADGELILATEARCREFQPSGAQGDENWRVLYIHMPGPVDSPEAPTGARSLVLQVGLLQPQQLGPSRTADPLGRFAIYQQDIRGTVWFDDIVVFQLPRVKISVPRTQRSPGAGMFGPSEPVQVDLLISDVRAHGTPDHAAAPLGATLRITDPEGLVLDVQRWQASPTAQSAWTHRYTRSALPAGQYTATLEVFETASPDAGGAPIARRQIPFLCFPADDAAQSQTPGIAREFALGAATWTDPQQWNDLTATLRQSGTGGVQLPAWRRTMSEDDLTRRDPPFETLLAGLQRLNVRTIAGFGELPEYLAQRLGAASHDPNTRQSIFALLERAPELWRPALAHLMTRYSNRIDLWQLGSPLAPFCGSPADVAAGTAGVANIAPALYRDIHAEISTLLSRPQVVISWNALYEFNAAEFPGAILDLRLPEVVKPSQIPAYLESFRQSGVPLIAHLDDSSEPRRMRRLADFARRVVYTRSAAPDWLVLDITHGQPDERLLVYRTLARALGGTTFAGELPLDSQSSGTRLGAFLFRHPQPARATLVLWSEGPDVPVELPLGPRPTVTDLLGNPAPSALVAALSTDTATRLTRLTATHVPLVIENVDPQPLLMSASFGLADRTLPAGVGAARTEVLLTNPYPHVLSGQLRLMAPRGWTVEPAGITISVAPGATLRQALTLRYPFGETAGIKYLPARLTLDPDHSGGLSQLNLTAAVTIGSDQIEMEALVHIQDNGDIQIQQIVTNISEGPINAQVYALVPGFQRAQRYVTDLLPGESTIKRFTFPASSFVATQAAPTLVSLRDHIATVGIRRGDGQTMLTRTIPLQSP